MAKHVLFPAVHWVPFQDILIVPYMGVANDVVFLAVLCLPFQDILIASRMEGVKIAR